MRRYNITVGAKTTAGGTVLTGWERAKIEGQPMSREGDMVFCPACGSEGVIVCAGPHLMELFEGRQTALEGDLCRCKCDPPPTLIANQCLKSQQFSADQRMPSTASTTASPAPSLAVPSGTTRPVNVCVFAKSCVSVPPGSTDAGTVPERADNFGATALLASTGATGTVGRIAGTLGSDLGAWAVRGFSGAAVGASSALNVVLLAFWPRTIGDATLYSPEQLANMRSASTRVRFQFRRDEAGEMRVYGLHTRPGSGTDRVPVTQARWNFGKSAMVADLDGLSITWRPNDGPVVNVPTPYPGTPERLDNLLVHPIPVGQETQLTHYPGQDADDLTWQDTIIVFPADSGVPLLYLVFAKPMVKPLEVGPAGELQSRSKKDGLDIDHIPAQKVLETALLQLDAKMPRQQVLDYLKRAPGIAIPTRVHRNHSETYGGRSTKAKQALGAVNLRAEVDSNVDAIKRGLLEEGYMESDIEAAREQLHQLNQKQGWY